MAQGAAALYADCERSLVSTGLTRLYPLRGSSLLITGGTGFVGSWLTTLVAFLNDRHGFDITLTNVARRRMPAAPYLDGRADISYISSDVRQLAEIAPRTSWIIHAAGNPDSRHHATNPVDTAAVIGEGTLRILRLAEQMAELRQLLHFSSALVYGDAGAPIAEEASGVAPRIGASSVYAEAKRYGEALCAAYRTQARLPIVVSRPFTFIGPFQSLDAPWAVNNFLHAAINGQPLKILGGGESERTYLYGSDMAVLALHQLVAGKSGNIYNLGGTDPLSLLDLARTVVATSGRQLEIRANVASRDASVSHLVPDMRRSARDFGFAPAFSPDEAVARTLSWHGAAAPRRRRTA